MIEEQQHTEMLFQLFSRNAYVCVNFWKLWKMSTNESSSYNLANVEEFKLMIDEPRT